MRKSTILTGKKALSAIIVLFLTASMIGCTGREAAGDDSAQAPEETGAAADSVSTAAEADTSSDNAAASEKDITLTHYYYTSSKDGVERATGKYTDITFSKDIQAKYPKLTEAVDELTTNWETQAKEAVGQYAFWFDEELNEGESFYDEQSISITRFDDRIFTVVNYSESYAGGAHPNHYAYTYNLDPATGNTYSLKDVLSKPEEFPAAIREKIGKDSPELLEEIDSFYYDGGDILADKLDADTYSFTVDDSGLHILFSPYEVASYAAGSFQVDFSYEEYPDLVTEAFKMSAPEDMSLRIDTVDAGTTEVEAKSYYESEEFDGEYDSVYISNPGWDYYFNENYKKDGDRHYLTLTQTKEDVSDWLDTGEWAQKMGVEVASPDYSDDTYEYVPYDGVMYDYMYNSISVIAKSDRAVVCDYNLSGICNGPDDKAGKTTAYTEYIRYAKIVDDTLYVEISHWGYAHEEPDNAYIVAIDLNTNEVIFRTAPLVANCGNFQIVDDTIICGYGFTAEPDYIYLLDRYTGKTVQQIPVKSAPYQFEIVDDTLYVATYNTAYEFKITK